MFWSGMSLKQLFLSGKDRRTWEGDKGGMQSLEATGDVLRGARYCLKWSVPVKLRGKEKKAVNIYSVPTTCLMQCLIMNILQPPRALCLGGKKKTTKQAIKNIRGRFFQGISTGAMGVGGWWCWQVFLRGEGTVIGFFVCYHSQVLLLPHG